MQIKHGLQLTKRSRTLFIPLFVSTNVVAESFAASKAKKKSRRQFKKLQLIRFIGGCHF